jgi:hypothetical protein
VLITVSNMRHLYDAGFRHSWGFLTHSYRPSFCWWEAVVVWETAVLVAISVFGVNVGAFYQSLLMIAALMLISHLQLGLKTYAHLQAGRAMVQGTHCLLLTTVAGLYFLPLGAVRPTATYGLVMGGILLAVHVVYVCSVLFQLLRLIDWPHGSALLCTIFERDTTAVQKVMRHLRVGAERWLVQCGLSCHCQCDCMPASLGKATCGLPTAHLWHCGKACTNLKSNSVMRLATATVETSSDYC